MYNNNGGTGHGHMPSSTVVRSCTEFSHERSHSSHSSSMSSSSPTVVSKLLIQPAHVKSQSMSRWLPSSNGRNPGVTLLHASEHVSIMPVRTIPAGRLKQLISSPHLPSHQNHLNSLPSSSISRQDGTGTSSSATMSMLPSPVSYASPHSASSPQGRTIRVAQPPPFMASGVTTTSFPSCSSSSHGPQQQQYLANSISVPTLHAPKHASTDAPPSGPHQFSRSALSASALGERFSRMSYDELMELARNQQSQIETNEAELDERRKAVALFGVARRTAGSETEQQQNAKMLMANLRAQIQRDEQELAQLGQCQKEARQVQEHNQAQGQELGQLESEYGHYENQLRHSVQKVDSLRNQLEAMYQRRAAAADAAVARQRQLNGLAGTAVEAGRKMSAERRPKASVSPFKSEAARDEPDRASPVKKGLNSSNSSCQPSSSQPSASVQTVHWRKDFQQLPADVHHQNSNGGGFFHAPAPPPVAVDKISLRRNSLNQAKRNSLISLTESGDEHLLAMLFSGEQRRGRNHISFGQSWEGQLAGMGGAGGGGLVANAKASLGFLNGGEKSVAAGRNNRSGWKEEEEAEVTRKAEANVQQQKKQEEPGQKQPSSIPVKSSPVKKAAMPYESGLDMFNKTFDQQQTRVEEKPGEEEEEEGEEVAKTESSEEEEEAEEGEEKKLEKQKLKLKQDKLDKQKLEFKQDKKEEPKLTEERKKPDEQLEEEEEEEESEEEEEKPHLAMERKAEGEAESSHSTETAMLDDIQLSLDANLQKFAHLEEEEGDGSQAEHAAVPGGSPTNSSSSAESVEKEEIQFDKSWHFQRPAGVVGILRRADKRKSSRRVQFDMVVLFLDVAYEGQFETLVELASKVEDISVANSEGITALHYAICASHEQIVHFLVDHGANVNALDVDGWSPLHCAASCNNLAMLRLLVENGACPFATTISKSETAAQIFYENNEYATGAEYMELVEECMGEVNDRKVYAAYSYEAEREDELGFEEGDELRVLRKAEREEEPREGEDEAKEDEEHEQAGDEPIQLWWLCENTRNGQIGLVPRNYLALFPSWKHRGRYQITYKLPAQPEGEEQQDNGQSHSEKESKDGLEEDEDGQMEGLISSVGGNKPLGHQELSTYA